MPPSNRPEVAIREACATDVDGVAEVHVQGWRESYGRLLSADALAGLSTSERARMWRGAFEHPDARACFLVAETEDHRIVGFCRGGPIRADNAAALGAEAEIYAIYLLAEVKRRGIGRRLMRRMFERLVAAGFGSAGLWVLRDNAPAAFFYDALGGVAGPQQTIEVRGDLVTEIGYRFDLIPKT